jgi:hypothetical protein
MNTSKSLLCTLTAGALLFAGSVFAQETPVPPPPPPAPAAPMPPPTPPTAPTPATPSTMPAASMPAASAAPMAAGGEATYQTPQGELTVRSAPAPAPTIGPAPPFEQLAAGGKGITEAQAEAYPPLANDFIHADHNRNGTVSAAEYREWLKQL